MKTIDASGYNYNENGTSYVVQKVVFEDFGGIDPATAAFTVMASFPDFDNAHYYFEQFCSGLQDDEYVCGNQDLSRALFFRIVQVREDTAR